MTEHAARPEFDAFVDAFHDHFTRDANACVFKGVNKRLGDLPDPSLRAAADAAANAEALLGRIDAVREATRAAGALDFDADLDLDLARLALEADRERETRHFAGRHRLAQLPDAAEVIGDGLLILFVNDPRPDAERVADMTTRLEQVAGYVAAVRERIDTPVKLWKEMELQRVPGLPEFFDTLEDWVHDHAEGIGDAERTRFADARGHAEAAIEDYGTWLEAQPTHTEIHVGRDLAEQIVRNRGVDLGLDELHGIARDYLSGVRDQIETLRRTLVARYDLDADLGPAELHTWLNEKFAVELPEGGALDAIIERYKEEHGKVLAFNETHELFPIFEAQDLAILRTPAFMEPTIPAGAMLQPPPFRDGVKRSLVYLTLHADQLDDHTELSIPSMMIHEGVPGHHLHLAWGATHDSVIRRHIDAMEQAEGWTTMLEDYMLDRGYMGDLVDEARFIGKWDICRIGARVAIDLFFMTGERHFLDVGVEAEIDDPDPIEAAMSLLRAVTGFSAGRAKAEVQWYSQERGYPLCYLTGNHLTWQLKRDLAAAQAGELEGLDLDRTFHQTFLEAGYMPIPFLRRVFEHRGLLPAAS